MFEPFLIVGGMLFWIFAGILGVIVLACVENEKATHATFTILGAFAVFWIWGDFNVLSWAANNILDFLIYLGSYIALGIIWMLVKWAIYVVIRKGEAAEFKARYCKGKGIDPENMSRLERTEFIDELISYTSPYKDDVFPPSAMCHKVSIIRWASYWPFSAFWTIFGRGLQHLWNFIYVQFSGLLQNISNKIMGDI